MKLAIITAGGITNFGERAIMLGTVYELRRQYPKAPIAIFGYDNLAKDDPALFKELAKYKVTYLSPLIKDGGKFAKMLQAIGIFCAPKLFIDRESYAYLKQATVYSKGQESFTQDYGFVHFIDSFLEQLLVSRFNPKVILYGHSIGPITKYRTLSRIVLRRFQKIYVRDARSKQLLLDIGYPANHIEQIKDLAYAAVAKYKTAEPAAKTSHYLIVPNAAICKTEAQTKQYLRNLKIITRYLQKQNTKVFVGSSVSASDWNNDYALCEQLIAACKGTELRKYHQLHEFLDDVRQAKTVISSRLHPLIMATGAGTPVFALSKSHKVLGLLGDLRMQDLIVDPFAKLDTGKLSSL